MELCITEEELQEFPETDITDKSMFTTKLLFNTVKTPETFKERLKLDKTTLAQSLGLDQLENKVNQLVTTAVKRPSVSGSELSVKAIDKLVRKRKSVDRSRRNETARETAPHKRRRVNSSGLIHGSTRDRRSDRDRFFLM